MTTTSLPRRIAAWWQPAGRFGVPQLLTVWMVLLFGISAKQVVGPLGAIGTPALLVAFAGAGWWLSSRVDPEIRADRGIQPVRVYMYGYLWYCLLTWALAHTRSLTALEQTGSIRAMFALLAFAGVAMLIMDGVEDLDQLRTILWRVVLGGAFLSLLGLLQSVTGSRLEIDLPLLSFNQDPNVVASRSLFNRPFATALHPIEFSVVLAALFPLALHFALEGDPDPTTRRRAVIAAALIGLGVPFSISRSGIVVFVVSMALILTAWSWRRRANAAIVGVVALPVLWLGVPGLVGTLRSLFTGAGNDPSVQNRIARIPAVMDLIREYPWFGRGIGTYSVDDYFLVDNEVYVSTIELGIVGICLTFGLFLLAMAAARTSRHHPRATRETNHLGMALAAGIAGISVSLVTFDAFHYHILNGVLYTMIGGCAALWRVTRRDLQP